MNEFQELEKTYQKYDLKYFTYSTIISTLLITFIYNLNIDSYFRIFIFPTIIILITYLLNIKHNTLDQNKRSYYFLIPIGLIFLNTFLFEVDFSNKFLNILVLPTITIYFLFYLLDKKYQITIKSFFLFLEECLNNLFNNLAPIKKLINKNSKSKNISQIGIGLVIGIPICIVLLSLLSSADMYFSSFMEHTLNKLIHLFNVEFILKNIVVIGISFILTFSFFINFMEKRKKEKDETKVLNVSTSSISTILILMNFVFLLFLITEISKLTTNFLHLPIEYTYAEYAREGFFQLLGITSINFLISILTIYKTKLKNNRLVKILLLILIGFSCLLIFNSYYRMVLYISAYTFTILRLQVILFLILELILFILLIKKITSELKYNNLKLFSILFLLFYILNLYLCNQVVIDFINKFLE